MTSKTKTPHPWLTRMERHLTLRLSGILHWYVSGSDWIVGLFSQKISHSLTTSDISVEVRITGPHDHHRLRDSEEYPIIVGICTCLDIIKREKILLQKLLSLKNVITNILCWPPVLKKASRKWWYNVNSTRTCPVPLGFQENRVSGCTHWCKWGRYTGPPADHNL